MGPVERHLRSSVASMPSSRGSASRRAPSPCPRAPRARAAISSRRRTTGWSGPRSWPQAMRCTSAYPIWPAAPVTVTWTGEAAMGAKATRLISRQPKRRRAAPRGPRRARRCARPRRRCPRRGRGGPGGRAGGTGAARRHARRPFRAGDRAPPLPSAAPKAHRATPRSPRGPRGTPGAGSGVARRFVEEATDLESFWELPGPGPGHVDGSERRTATRGRQPGCRHHRSEHLRRG